MGMQIIWIVDVNDEELFRMQIKLSRNMEDWECKLSKTCMHISGNVIIGIVHMDD